MPLKNNQPHLRISQHGPQQYVTAYSVILVGTNQKRTRLCTVGSKREAESRANQFASEMRLQVKGQGGAAYQKFRRAEFAKRQRRILSRQS